MLARHFQAQRAIARLAKVIKQRHVSSHQQKNAGGNKHKAFNKAKYTNHARTSCDAWARTDILNLNVSADFINIINSAQPAYKSSHISIQEEWASHKQTFPRRTCNVFSCGSTSGQSSMLKQKIRHTPYHIRPSAKSSVSQWKFCRHNDNFIRHQNLSQVHIKENRIQNHSSQQRSICMYHKQENR